MEGWAIALREVGTGKVILMTADMEDNPDVYEKDAHVVPCRLKEGGYDFGVHDCERTCYCHPEIRKNCNRTFLVIHSERVN